MTQPILTVAVPSYNVEAYLDKTLTSMGDPRFNGRLEVIVVNDGSQDRTQEIAERYAAQWPEIIRVVNKENGGHGSGVNVGMTQGRGKYFRIIDGDDWVDPEAMARLLDALERSEEDIVITELTEVDMTTGREKRITFPESIYEREVYTMEELAARPEYDGCFRLHSMNTRMDLIRREGVLLPEHCFYVDYVFILLTTGAAKAVRVIRDDVYRYLVGNVNQSVSYGNFVKRYEQHDRVLRTCVDFFNHYQGTPGMMDYVLRKTNAIINTAMNIALLFDEDRKRGEARAQALRSYLESTAPKLAEISASRYAKVRRLHRLGVGAKGFEWINKLRGV